MRNRLLLPIFVVSISILLTQLVGCAHFPSARSSSFHYISPSVRNQQLKTIQHWTIRGALSIQSPKQSVIAHYQWKQTQANYHINLSSTLNLVQATVTGKQNQFVELCRSVKDCFTAQTPEILLQEQLGWSLPISYLNYWVRGVPVPDGPSTLKYDSFGHLVLMHQHGFNIKYSRYKTYSGIDLPGRIDLQYPNLNIRLTISQWNL
jgi:outer membrane lipoprotein LolB